MFLSAKQSPRAKIQLFLEHFQISLPTALQNFTFTQTWKRLILAASTAHVLEGASVLKRRGERTKKQNKKTLTDVVLNQRLVKWWPACSAAQNFTFAEQWT